MFYAYKGPKFLQARIIESESPTPSDPSFSLNLSSLSLYNCRDIIKRIFTHTGTNANFIRFIRMSQMKLRKWRTSAVSTAAYSI